MVEKSISWGVYNLAKVKSINELGEPLCDLCFIEDNQECIILDRNISFPVDNIPFELTDNEIEEILNPKEVING